MSKHLKKQSSLHSDRHLQSKEALVSCWKPLRRFRNKSEAEFKIKLEELGIKVQGKNAPFPCPNFKAFRFPCILSQYLEESYVLTSEMKQVIPAVLMRRDVCATVSEQKSRILCFVLPVIMICLEEEMKLSLESGEGPFALILCASHDQARKVFDLINEMLAVLSKVETLAQIKCCLCVDTNPSEQAQIIIGVLSTISQFVFTKQLFLDSLSCLICDDLLLEDTDSQLHKLELLLAEIQHEIQVVVTSSEFFSGFGSLFDSFLTDRLVINQVTAMLHEVCFAYASDKDWFLLESIQKTCPPVVIICSKQDDVDRIDKFLYRKGVNCARLSESFDLSKRSERISALLSKELDVLVASESNFEFERTSIRHFIWYDVSQGISILRRLVESFESSRVAFVTTLIDERVSSPILRDLKILLLETKQFVPPCFPYFLATTRPAPYHPSVYGQVE